MRRNPRRESFSKKEMKRLSTRKIKKTQILSRMSRFIRDEAIQLKAKFASANLMRSTKSLLQKISRHLVFLARKCIETYMPELKKLNNEEI